MEEKERYEVKRLDYSLNVKLTDNYEPDWHYIIFDDVNDKELAKLETVCDWLNQKDKRIKELEETNKVLSNELTKNSILKQDHIETCCGIPIFEIPKIKKENQQLKQQLHDLPKKIVEEIEKNFTEYLPLKDKTGAGFYCRLNAILKKFGGEDE